MSAWAIFDYAELSGKNKIAEEREKKVKKDEKHAVPHKF